MYDARFLIVPAVVILIWLGSALLFGKRVKDDKARFIPDTNRPNGHLTVVRAIEPTNYARRFSIIIDGQVVAKIGPGQTVHLRLKDGTYNIRTRVDFCRTKPVKVQVDSSRNTEVECGSTYNDWRCMFMWIIKPHDYLYLRTAA